MCNTKWIRAMRYGHSPWNSVAKWTIFVLNKVRVWRHWIACEQALQCALAAGGGGGGGGGRKESLQLRLWNLNSNFNFPVADPRRLSCQSAPENLLPWSGPHPGEGGRSSPWFRWEAYTKSFRLCPPVLWEALRCWWIYCWFLNPRSWNAEHTLITQDTCNEKKTLTQTT